MRALIDTNVLVYDTFEDSIYHEEAVKMLDKLDDWVIPLIVIYEYVWFLKGLKISTSDVYEKVLEYLEESKTTLVPEGYWEVKWSLLKLLREEISLSRFNDKIILATAIRHELPLASFDKKLRRQAKKNGVTVLPAKI